MKTVLQEGDFVLVNRMHGASNPGRDRVVIFKSPLDRDAESPPLLLSRCVGMPGDTILITPDGYSVNSRPMQAASVKAFRIRKNVKPALLETLHRLDIPLRSVAEDSLSMTIRLTAGEESLLRIHLHQALQIESATETPQQAYRLVIPFAGYDYRPDTTSLFFYAHIIRQETNGRIQYDGTRLSAEGKELTAYRFVRNYYWMLSDDGDAVDSRHLGPVPRTCVIGNVLICWFGRNKNRIFKRIY
jgi:signal peptidase I